MIDWPKLGDWIADRRHWIAGPALIVLAWRLPILDYVLVVTLAGLHLIVSDSQLRTLRLCREAREAAIEAVRLAASAMREMREEDDR